MGEDRARLLEELSGSSPDALVVIGEDGVIEVAGAATEAIFGYRPEELEGQPVELLLPETVRAVHRVHRATYAAAPENRPMGVGLDLYGRHRDGHEFPVDVSLVPVVSNGRRRFGAFVRDVTDRKRGEDVFRFVNDLSLAVISGEPTGDLLGRTARAARVLVGAAVAWISVRSGDVMMVAAADGEGSPTLDGASIPVSTSLAARAMLGRETVEVADMSLDSDVMVEARGLGLGAGVYLPMQAEGGPVGSLVPGPRTG